MTGRIRTGAALVGALMLMLVASALAYDSSRQDTIASGVRVAGVDVGGMSATEAERALGSRLRARVDRPVRARYGRRTFVLTAKQAGTQPDIAGMVYDAVARSRGGWFVGRSLDAVLGRSLRVDVPPRLTYSSQAVDRFVASVDAALDRPPRDATVSFDVSGPHIVRERSGLTVEDGHLRDALDAALGGTGPHTIAIATRSTPATVTAAQLPARYPAAIVIDRPAFELRLYRRLRLAKTYPVAIGMQGLETPAGLYHVQEKQVDPPWVVPNSPWAGSLAGQVIPPGPQDPLKARWIGFDGAAGIHGTDETGSIGTAGSHGCVRMLIPDVIELYPQVKVGDPVYVA